MNLLKRSSCFLVTTACLLTAFNASARDFEKRFDQTLRGGAFSVSNILLTCDNDADSRCDGAKDFTGSVYQNGPFRMINVDVDSDGTTFNSSSADLKLPVDSMIVHAELYWAGLYFDYDAPHKFFLPPDASKKDEVLFKIPGGTYANVKGAVDEEGGFYQGHADVTSLVNGSGTYTLANAQLTTGKQMYGGWTLVVVVESKYEPLRRVVLWDGFLKHASGSLKVELADTLGSRRNASSVEMNLVQYDGDKGNSDSLLVDQNLLVPKNNYPTSDPAPAGDIGNSTITQFGDRFEDRNPFYLNTLGYDSDLFQINTLVDTDADISLDFKTAGDIKHIGIISVQSDIEDRFIQTDWIDGANGTSSVLMDSETGFLNKAGHIFHDTTSGGLHAVQFSYSYDGLQYEVAPVRDNRSDSSYYGQWRTTGSIYPKGACLGTKYWIYREVDRSRVSWMFGAGRRGSARPACDGNFATRYVITGGANLILSDDAGESNLVRTQTRWVGTYTDGHIIRFSGREFKVEGQAIVTTTTALSHFFYLDTNNNRIAYDLSAPKIWSFESDFDGRLESKIFDGLVPRGFGNLDLDFSETNGSVAQVFFRTGDSIADVQSKAWEGPFFDGDLLGTATTNNHQFFQYAAVSTLTDPANNTVESELTLNEISFDLYGISLPIVNSVPGTWKRVEDAPIQEDVLKPVPSVDLTLQTFEPEVADVSVDIDPYLGIDDSACSIAGRTITWFPLLMIGMFWRRRKR